MFLVVILCTASYWEPLQINILLSHGLGRHHKANNEVSLDNHCHVSDAFSANAHCASSLNPETVPRLSAAIPTLSAVKWDLIILAVLGYFPTELKGDSDCWRDWSGSNLSPRFHFTAHLICHSADEYATSSKGKRGDIMNVKHTRGKRQCENKGDRRWAVLCCAVLCCAWPQCNYSVDPV